MAEYWEREFLRDFFIALFKVRIILKKIDDDFMALEAFDRLIDNIWVNLRN